MQNQMMNKSGLKPLGRAVLLKMVELDEVKSKTIVIPEHVKANSAAMEQRALVVEVGAEAWSDEKEPRCQPGDKVYITKLAGFIARGADGELYRMVNDREVFCKITEEARG